MAVTRRIACLGLAALSVATRPSPAQPVPERDGLRRLFSAAALQARAASLAATRDTRPEIKAFAAEMAAWRPAQMESLRAILRERHVEQLGLVPEHEAAWEGMETLDYLALSRRYAEVQVALLEWEIATYANASQTGDAALVAYAEGLLPELRRLLGGAHRAHAAVMP
jgi:predicted outer membrane protein